MTYLTPAELSHITGYAQAAKHAQMQTTSIYRRRVAGRSAKPAMRKIKGG